MRALFVAVGPFVSASVLLQGPVVRAADFPVRPIRLVVPFAPGGSVDISSRILAVPLSQMFGQQIVVDNRAGAGGAIGAGIVINAAADGYTLFAGSSGSLTANRAVYSKLPYDSQRDFIPLSMINVTPMIIVTHPGVPATSLKELIELARRQPGKLVMASAGTGSSNHLAIELFQSETQTRFLHVPYKGSGQVYPDLLGGQVQVTIDQIASSIGFIQGGRLRAIAVTALTRSSVLPNVPTADESGLRGFEAASFTGVLAPRGTPAPVVARLYEAIVKAARSPMVVERFRELAAEPRTTTPEEFREFMQRDIAKWAKVAQQANIRLD